MSIEAGRHGPSSGGGERANPRRPHVSTTRCATVFPKPSTRGIQTANAPRGGALMSPTKRKTVEVRPARGDSSGWEVARQGSAKPISTHRTQSAAMKKANPIARREHGEFVLKAAAVASAIARAIEAAAD